MNIKYVFIGKLSNNKTIGYYPQDADEKWIRDSRLLLDKYQNTIEANNIKKLISPQLNIGQDGNYHFNAYDDIFMLVISNFTYPPNQVQNLMEEINRDHIYLLVDDTGCLNKVGRNSLKNIVNLYQNSNITTLRNEVRDVKNEVKQNISKLVVNSDDVKGLEMKSYKINENSKQLLRDATSLKHQTFIQKWKWVILIGLIVLFFLLLIVPKLFSKKGEINEVNKVSADVNSR
jgi:hypothetical protein